jgi:MFS family permease
MLGRSIVSATRLHLPADEAIPKATQDHLRAYVQNVQQLGVTAAIAVNSHQEEVRLLAESVAPELELHILHVPCWGAFVPALNTLLEFAQRRGATYILYQSLEVQCSTVVLNKLLDHFNENVLVVGPVLQGHMFDSGEQTLNGRTTPWNTLALWSVRKLALTGFPRIADGLTRQLTPDENTAWDELKSGFLGSANWWSTSRPENLVDTSEVPAGVEEVTAIALLQHLLGRHRAVAVLLALPRHLAESITWQATWEHDERRKQWHEYKMKSKVARPHAQLQELFSLDRGSTKHDVGGSEDLAVNLNLGTVMHFGTSISPSSQLQYICLAAVAIFYFNSNAVLAEVFRCINASSGGNLSASMMTFAGIVIGGVYILMPISLQLTRTLTQRWGHIAGFLFFAVILLVSHLCIIASQFGGSDYTRRAVLLAARIMQGLGSGVPFQSRFVLASSSTSDMHTDLQARAFIAGDLGLCLGALLPAVTSWISGYEDAFNSPELWPSIVQVLICSCFVVWVLLMFPRHLHTLPDRVRFASHSDKPASASASTDKPTAGNELDKLSIELDAARHEAAKFKIPLLVSGTARVFVQSAMIPAVALIMYDAQLTGHFRQCIAVALLFLLQLPFEALVSRMCCLRHATPPSKHGMMQSRVVLGGSMTMLLIVNVAMCFISASDDQNENLARRRLFELVALAVTLAVASPFNASRLYQLQDAEHTIVVLEWMKAYIGRLLGPLLAVLIYTQVGYGPLLTILCLATIVVTFTA